MSMRRWLQHTAKRIKYDVLTVYCIARDKHTPWSIRLLALFIAAYAISPIDLVPDFIPVLGFLDDMIVLPLGIWLVIKLTPMPIVAANRVQAKTLTQRPKSMIAAVTIVLLWLGVAWLVVHWTRAWWVSI